MITTHVFVLIVVLNGWGAGPGSAGNAVGMTTFASQERCEAAAREVSSLKTIAMAKCFQR